MSLFFDTTIEPTLQPTLPPTIIHIPTSVSEGAHSFAQYQGLFWTGCFASCASIAGSSIIVWNITRRWRIQRGKKDNNNNTNNNNNNEENASPSLGLQHRLLLALSLNDMFASLNSVVIPMMIPRGTPGHYWAAGNSTTCTISGFLSVMFFLSVTCYNCSLSLYYLLTIRYGMAEKDLMTKWPWLLERQTHIITWVTALTIPILGIVWDGYVPKIFVNICFLDSCGIQELHERNGQCPEYTSIQDALPDILAAVYIGTIAIFTIPSCIATVLVYRSVKRTITSGVAFSYQNLPQDLARERLQLVASQAVAYSLIYMNLLLWQSILAQLGGISEAWAYENEGRADLYIIQLLSWTFIPGQGFLNCLVYSRPKYLRWRQTYPKGNVFWLYWKAVQMEPPPQRSVASATSFDPMIRQQRKNGYIVPPTTNADAPPEYAEAAAIVEGISSITQTQDILPLSSSVNIESAGDSVDGLFNVSKSDDGAKRDNISNTSSSNSGSKTNIETNHADNTLQIKYLSQSVPTTQQQGGSFWRQPQQSTPPPQQEGSFWRQPGLSTGQRKRITKAMQPDRNSSDFSGFSENDNDTPPPNRSYWGNVGAQAIPIPTAPTEESTPSASPRRPLSVEDDSSCLAEYVESGSVPEIGPSNNSTGMGLAPSFPMPLPSNVHSLHLVCQQPLSETTIVEEDEEEAENDDDHDHDHDGTQDLEDSNVVSRDTGTQSTQDSPVLTSPASTKKSVGMDGAIRELGEK